MLLINTKSQWQIHRSSRWAINYHVLVRESFDRTRSTWTKRSTRWSTWSRWGSPRSATPGSLFPPVRTLFPLTRSTQQLRGRNCADDDVKIMGYDEDNDHDIEDCKKLQSILSQKRLDATTLAAGSKEKPVGIVLKKTRSYEWVVLYCFCLFSLFACVLERALWLLYHSVFHIH